MQILDSGVFWPLNTDPLFRLVGRVPVPDLRPPARLGRREAAGRGRRGGRQLARRYAATAARSFTGLVAVAAARLVLLVRAHDDRRARVGRGPAVDQRCVVVAGPPQRSQTAWSLSTNSAWASNSGIGPNGSRRKSWSSPATITRGAAVSEGERGADDLAVEELDLVESRRPPCRERARQAQRRR